MWKKSFILSLSFLVLFIVCRPLLQPTLFHIHDYLHVARIAEAARGLESGHIPLRWSQAFNFGYGMPLFTFYAPLPSIIGALFVLLGVPLITSFKLVYVLVSGVTLLGSYLLGREMYNRTGGLLLAVLFTLAPYRAVNLYIRGALSETWGMAFYPWILLGMVLVVKRKKWGVLCLSLSVAGLALSHNLSLIIFLPLALVWGLALVGVYVIQQKKPSERITALSCLSRIAVSYTRLILMALLGLGISAFYILPAFLEKNLVQVEKLTTSYYFSFQLHFVYLRQFITNYWGYGGSAWGPDDGISFFLGFGLLMGVILTVTLLLLTGLSMLLKNASTSQDRWLKPLRTRKLVFASLLALFSLTIGAVALVLTTQKTLLFWNSLSLLRFIQFPWRYLSAASIFLALSISFLCLIPWQKLRYAVAGLLICVSLVGAWNYFWPETFLDHDAALYYGESDKISSQLSSVLLDYVPAGLPLDTEPVYDILSTESAALSHQVLVNRPHEKVIRISSQVEQPLKLSIAWYPGWKAYVNGAPVLLEEPHDYLRVTLPSGDHVLSLKLTQTPLQQISTMISILSLSMLLSYGVYQELRKRS